MQKTAQRPRQPSLSLPGSGIIFGRLSTRKDSRYVPLKAAGLQGCSLLRLRLCKKLAKRISCGQRGQESYWKRGMIAYDS